MSFASSMLEPLTNALSDYDQNAINAKGINVSEILFQLEQLVQQKTHVEIDRPATLGDGIQALPPIESCNRFLNAAAQGRISAFIPASGDATRLFDSLFRVYTKGDTSEATLLQESKAGDKHATEALKVLRNIKDFAIWTELERMGCDSSDWTGILDTMFSPDRLALNRKPKGLIPFHRYGVTTRTAIEEHCISALGMGFNKVHFTIRNDFKSEMEKTVSIIANDARVKYCNSIDIGFNYQSSRTDTIALTEDGKIFRDQHGNIVFRAGGHGSLLVNLEEMSGDIVFLRNIDNVVVGNKSLEINNVRKILCERLLELEEKIHRALHKLDSHGDISDAVSVMEHDLGLPVYSKAQTPDYYFDQLNRPIRVCGVVRNQGDVGGGPFWTRAKGDISRVQIVEGSELANSSNEQLEIAKQAEYFNPVEIVCSIRDFNGLPFDLFSFRDEGAAILTKKSKNGHTLFVYEHPGLWNGGMARWNSVFVEVPAATFHPVKQFSDLLKPFHRNEVENAAAEGIADVCGRMAAEASPT